MGVKWKNRELSLGFFILLIWPLWGIAQKGQVILLADNLTVQQVFNEVTTQNRAINFIYSDLGQEPTVRLKRKGSRQPQAVKDILNLITQQTKLRFTINGNDIIVRAATESRQINDFVTLSGTVQQKDNGPTLGYANVILQSTSVKQRKYNTVAGSDGRFYFQAIPKDQYILSATFVGYRSISQQLQLKSPTSTLLLMESTWQEVSEISVTATEQKGMATSSVIKREAIEHMQATSLTDLLSLLPGGQSVPPSLTSPNLIRLREANAPVGADYAISSLGTLFVVDDIPISTDANMQFMNVTSATTDVGGKQYVNFGVDMRGIPTDNIERLEIIRGIPSVRYGDLTSGVVKIDRLLEPLPLEARFKLDQFSKLFSLSKGHTLGKDWLLVGDVTYLDGKNNPIDPLENYDRYTASLRSEKIWKPYEGKQLRWRVAADYTGQFDDWKNDAEQLLDKELYKLSYQSTGFSSRLAWSQPKNLFKLIEFNGNIRYSVDRIYRERWPSNAQDRGIVPISLGPGVHEAIVLPGSYLAKHEVDGRPFNAFATLRSESALKTGHIAHHIQLGAEWRMDKNYGAGQIFDIARPVNNSFGVRPYRYDRIPANQQLSYYVEDRITLPKWYDSRLHIQAGLRGGTILGLDTRYTLNNKFYNDPRINLQLELPAIPIHGKAMNFTLTGGMGWLTKMPTMSMLHPDIVYVDFVEFRHNNVKPEYSYSQVRTYVEDRINYDLSYTRNKKKDLRIDAEWNKHQLSVTWFNEVLTDGFRSMSEPKAYDYNYYGMINVPNHPSRPDLTNMPYEERTVFRSVGRQGNGSELTKKGMEFTFNTPRYALLSTRFTFNGAYFKNSYQNSQPKWFLGNSKNNPVIDGFIVFDHYAALYPQWIEGYDRTRTSTTFTADTYLKKHGLTLSLSAETYWKGKNDQKANNPAYPSYYLTTDNVLHPYTESDKKDMYLSSLYFEDEYSGFYLDNKSLTRLNFRGSKDFGTWLRLSLFVLNFAEINPHYKNYEGIRVKDVAAAPYFGMELKIRL